VWAGRHCWPPVGENPLTDEAPGALLCCFRIAQRAVANIGDGDKRSPAGAHYFHCHSGSRGY